jgi:hypothetical protein
MPEIPQIPPTEMTPKSVKPVPEKRYRKKTPSPLNTADNTRSAGQVLYGMAKPDNASPSSNSDSYVQMYGQIIMDNIQRIVHINTTGTKSEAHRIFDEETQKNYYVKVVRSHEEGTSSPDSPGSKPPEKPITIHDRNVAPWFERPPEASTAEYGKRLAEHYDKMARYKNLHIPPTRIISIKLENGTYRHVILQEEVPGKILRMQFPHAPGSIGDEKYEQSMFEQLKAASSESIPKLRSLTLDLIDLLNKERFIPDLNFGVLSTDNIIFDAHAGTLSFVDIDDHFPLPKIFTDQLEPGEVLMSDEGVVNPKLIEFIHTNSQYDEPYMGRFEDWLNSMKNILAWSTPATK